MLNNLIKKRLKKFKFATLMDDLKFRKLCESKEAIEEILRVVLSDDNIVVINVNKQNAVDEPVFHGVILDCKCWLKTDEIVNIEIQVSHNDNPTYRMRYNGAILTVENSPKKKVFKYSEIPRLILIMFCDFDLFKLNKPIYEIVRCVKGTNITVDNGIRELYINLKANSQDKKLNSLFKIMTTLDVVDNEEFPMLSKRKEEINNLDIGGKNNMNGILLDVYEDGIKQGIEQGKIKLLVGLFNDKKISATEAANYLAMSVDEFLGFVKNK